jgi:S-methylmethionine-dependent homocysteine/selenocysteine methylase
MPVVRPRLPQLANRIFLTDGGLETSLIFHDGLELPHFAAFDLMRSEEGRAVLVAYYERYIAIARKHELGFILESPTWRASTDWGAKLGYTPDEIAAINRQSIAMMRDLRIVHESSATPMVLSGCVGPRGDGYDPGLTMSADEAASYHAHQISAFAAAGADMATAITMTNAAEAIGIARAARQVHLPVAISFTVETDGRLPTGQPLGEAIAEVDAATGHAPAYYMLNCAHPTHFDVTLETSADWMQRIRGLRANASRRSHQELNDAAELDAGDPVELASQYRGLRRRFPQIAVLGGCCGTDHRHIDQIGLACAAGS